MGEFGGNFCEVANGDRTIDPQAVGFDEYSLFFEPCEEVVVLAVEFDWTKVLITKHIATDADMSLFMFIVVSGRDFEEFFEFGFASWKQFNASLSC